MGVLGIETPNHSLNALFMYTHDATEKVTLAEDTRGKKLAFPGYDPYNPDDVGNNEYNRLYRPYRRSEAIEYTERYTQTIQLHGKHTLLPDFGLKIGNFLNFLSPELDWTVAWSSAGMNQPDKKLFISYWVAANSEGDTEGHWEDKGPNINLGNFHRIWKEITEDSEQFSMNLKIPFEQWSGDKGYFKLGWFDDEVTRKYKQESFSNTDGDDDSWLNHSWEEYWSSVFAGQGHEIYPSDFDVDYDGFQKITAFYYMADVPFCSFFNIIGGFRFERTELSIKNHPDVDSDGNILATWYIPETGEGPIAFDPADTDVTFQQDDILPMIGFEFKPFKKVTLRGSYSETVARQTFKELSPIAQMEYLGGPVFIGNPNLGMSALKNYDLRLDWTPYEGGLFSTSYFVKKIEDPIEYSQGYAGFNYTYPTNYPKGELSGFEFELRQDMGYLFKSMKGLSIGANATFIESEVTLPDWEAENLRANGTPAPTRDMSNAPEYLYNFFLTYNMERLGLPNTDFSIFYTFKGETLIAGARAAAGGGEYIPDVYELGYGTLNLGLSHKFGKNWTLKFQAKNLLDPDIESVYRFPSYMGGDFTKTSHQKGREFSLSLSATF
jgi:TonB-dependent receptor